MKLFVVSMILLASQSSLAAFSNSIVQTHKSFRRQRGVSLSHKVDFQQDWERYPAPDAILQELAQLFPRVTLASGEEECRALTNDNRSLLGDNNPITGYASVNQPNSSFVSWYNGCLIKYLATDFAVRFDFQHYSSATNQPIMNTVGNFKTSMIEYLGKDYSSICKMSDAEASAHPAESTNVDVYMSRFSACSWRSLSRKDQLDVINHNISLLIGPPEVVADLGIEKQAGELAQKVLAAVESMSADRNFNLPTLNLVFNDNEQKNGQRSLQVLSATELARFLILQTSFLKY